jgi:hypothetical protein
MGNYQRLQEQLEEWLGRLDPASLVVAKDFIEKWKVLATGWQDSKFPLGTIWHATSPTTLRGPAAWVNCGPEAAPTIHRDSVLRPLRDL